LLAIDACFAPAGGGEVRWQFGHVRPGRAAAGSHGPGPRDRGGVPTPACRV